MELFVDKNTDQMRSTFIVVGLAELLYRIPPHGSGQEVLIFDLGSCYRVTSSLSAEELTDYIEHDKFLKPLLPAITKPLTEKERKLLDGGTPETELLLKYLPRDFAGEHIKYGDHKAIFDTYRKYRPKKNAPREEGAPPEPVADFPVWAHLCSYFGKGSAMRTGYPGVLHAWHAHQGDAALALWELIQACYRRFPNATEDARRIWEEQFREQLAYVDYALETNISALAVVSPSTSKGVSATSGFNRLVEDTPGEFWLEMYFAFAGFLRVGMPYTIGSDVVTYYPLPRHIRYKSLQDLMAAHRKSSATRSLYRYSNSMPRAKLDILNHITFYSNMLEHFIDSIADGTLPDDEILDAINGLVGYYYKDISTQIPFDETTFALPPWIPSDADVDTLDAMQRLLDEDHRRLIDSIRGKPPKYQMTADELTLLDHYRRYITQGNADDWIGFAIAYGMYHFRNLPDMPKFPALSLTVFKESLPMPLSNTDRVDYRPILDNPGFQKIANAINYCTSYSRYKKDVQKDPTFPFKVRHGLGDDLLRNAHDPELFLIDLSEFVHDYRRESINVQANTRKGRSEIEPNDLHDVTGLVAEYGSRIVAHLLVATGYAAQFDRDKQDR